MTQTTDATNPFSEGDHGAPKHSHLADQNALGDGTCSQSSQTLEVHICDLDTKHLSYRILILPVDVETLHVTDCQHRLELVNPKPKTVRRCAPASCLAVYDEHRPTTCRIQSPILCDLCYDATTDEVRVKNHSEAPLVFQPLVLQDVAAAQSIKRSCLAALSPGYWLCISSGFPIFQIQVFPRKHSLSLVCRPKRVPRKKRPLADVDCSEGNAREGSTSFQVIKSIASLIDVPKHSTVLATGPSCEFSIFRMKTICDTRGALLFQARHSGFPKQTIVVKVLKRRPGRSADSCAASWKREFDTHKQIKSEYIVQLLGGDIHFQVLYMVHVNAPDLGKSKWCDFKGDKRFLGDSSDAERVLRDMAAALKYLHNKKLIHNDIKPGNILYDRKIGAKLIDFGLGTSTTAESSTGGTPWYLPPEFLSRGRRGTPGDVYALGIVAVYLLDYIAIPESGQQWLIADVHSSDASSAAVAMWNWLQSIRLVREQLKRNVDQVHQLTLRMLSPTPNERITACQLSGDFTELAKALAKAS
ncbi:uncharacterized protein CTRU02_215458 [Colletotrichum truncatum]|uniref:Uncharacterized protein n=1 Tax=Colletotrichum truncatum TaxID=5467 RepID=A0ACC3YCH4_COLTU